ncbi:MAG: T9SS type A sorting domain-containing protein [Bacteroidales bacterium]|nr:T9SS type A sorting domain-containing protein [Bacteroidales bacterium]MCF8457798.1 T9SS type A sorting domain-containing protein [Bacteroidales bacterium]
MKKNHLPSIKSFTLLIVGLVVSISAFSQPGWSYLNTGSNHTILIPDGVVYVNSAPIEVGDYIGVFYDASGVLTCGGYTMWPGGGPTVVTAWGSETGVDNGFQPGEVFTWKIWKASLNLEFDAFATYSPTPPFNSQGTYATNSFSGIATLMTSNEIFPVITDVTCSGLDDGAIDITINFGTSPYSFLWSNGATTEDLINLPPGSYSVSVTDALAVSHSLSMVVDEPVELETDLLVDESNAFMCGALAQAIPSGGTGLYSFIWDDPAMQTTAVASDLCPGTYHVIISDANGCQLDTALVIDPNSITVTDTAINLVDTCLLNNAPDTAYISNISYSGSSMSVQWTIIEGANTHVITSIYVSITSSGTYYMALTINCGTKFITEITLVSVIEITPEVFSINEVKPSEFSCMINPNPIKEDLNFQVFNAEGKILKVEIYNSIGCQLLESEIELSTNKQNTIALPDLAPGIYFAKVFNEFNQNAVVKFIK